MIIDTLIQKIEEKVKQVDGTYITKHRQTSADIVLYDTGEKDDNENTIYSEVQTEINSIKEINNNFNETIKNITTKLKTLSDLFHGIVKVSNVVNGTSTSEIPTSYAVKNFFDNNFQDNLSADMKKSTYDTNNSGVVDNSEKLGGKLPSFYQKATDEILQTEDKTITGAINEIYNKEVNPVNPLEAEVEGKAADAKLTGDALRDLNAKIRGVVLWTNPNPESTFAPQKITLSSSDYDKYKIRWKSSNVTSDFYTTSEINKGDGTVLSLITTGGAGAGAATRRVAYESDTVLDAKAASFAWGSTAATNNNTWCIPVEVIGFKS